MQTLQLYENSYWISITDRMLPVDIYYFGWYFFFWVEKV